MPPCLLSPPVLKLHFCSHAPPFSPSAGGITLWGLTALLIGLVFPSGGPLREESPTFGLHNGTSFQISSDIRLENEVHNECNALESSPNRPPASWSTEKSSSPKLVPGVKKVGDHRLKRSLPGTPTVAGLPVYHCIPDCFSDSQPTFKLPVEDLHRNCLLSQFSASPQVFCLENPHALSQIFSFLLPCCFMAHSQPLPQHRPYSPPPTHPYWPTLSTPERLSFLPQHLGDSRVLLLSKTQVLQCCPTASLSMAVWLKVWARLLLASEHSLVLLQVPNFSSGCWTQGRLTKTVLDPASLGKNAVID